MDIFTNKPLNCEHFNFSLWQTRNGEYLSIHQVRSDYLETCICTLEHYMNHYPQHQNYAIWSTYINIIEDELAIRND